MGQRVKLRYEWVYLVLGVDPMKGRLWWDWVKRVRGGRDSSGAQGVEGDRGVVWDHAAFHKAKVVGEVGLRRIYQPPYLPELHPAERMLEEVSAVGRGEDLWEHRGEVGGCGRGVATVGSREKGLIAGRVAAYPSSFEYPAFMSKNLCL